MESTHARYAILFKQISEDEYDERDPRHLYIQTAARNAEMLDVILAHRGWDPDGDADFTYELGRRMVDDPDLDFVWLDQIEHLPYVKARAFVEEWVGNID